MLNFLETKNSLKLQIIRGYSSFSLSAFGTTSLPVVDSAVSDSKKFKYFTVHLLSTKITSVLPSTGCLIPRRCSISLRLDRQHGCVIKFKLKS